MKAELLTLGCLLALASGLPAERSCNGWKERLSRGLQSRSSRRADLQVPALSVRSCDGDGDGALNAVEFAGCLQRLSSTEGKRDAHRLESERAACFQSFMKQADEDRDNAVSGAELERWSARLEASSATSLRSSSYEAPRAGLYCTQLCFFNDNCLEDQRCVWFQCCSEGGEGQGGDGGSGSNGGNGGDSNTGGDGGDGNSGGAGGDGNGGGNGGNSNTAGDGGDGITGGKGGDGNNGGDGGDSNTAGDGGDGIGGGDGGAGGDGTNGGNGGDSNTGGDGGDGKTSGER